MTPDEPSAAAWQFAAKALLYTVQFERSLDDAEMITARAERMIASPPFDEPLDQTVIALRRARDSPGQLTDLLPQPHSEHDVRRFMSRLLDELADRKPWPRPRFVQVRADAHAGALEAPVIAHSELSAHQLAQRLPRVTQTVRGYSVIVVEFAAGDVVAVVDDTPIGQRGGSTVRYSGPRPRIEVIADILAVTLLGPDQLT